MRLTVVLIFRMATSYLNTFLWLTCYTAFVSSIDEGLVRRLVLRLSDGMEGLKAGLQLIDQDLEDLEMALQDSNSTEETQNAGIPCNDLTGVLSYGGTISNTRFGVPCQKWSEQSPHEHGFTEDRMFPGDGSVSGADNYCRDPDHEGVPWCYTTQHWTRWDFCDVPICNLDCWYGDKSRYYHGNSNTTVSGLTCQPWSDQFPHEHTNDVPNRFPLDDSVTSARNYCRDPDKTGALWCYTTDPDVRWEYCDNKCGQ